MNTKKKEENLLLNNRRKGTTINHNLKEKNVNAYGKNIIQLETTGNNSIDIGGNVATNALKSLNGSAGLSDLINGPLVNLNNCNNGGNGNGGNGNGNKK